MRRQRRCTLLKQQWRRERCPPHVGMSDLRVADVATREDSDAYVAALRASAVMIGLTKATARWSAAEPAFENFEEPDSACKIVMLSELTGEGRSRSLLNPNVT